MRRYLIVTFLHLSLFSQSQKIQHDWENYVLAVDGKPVSVNVDLGLSSKAPIKERPFVIILRTKIKNPDTQGMPYPEEYAPLLSIEDSLIYNLGKETGAIFTGRFTQRGLREFYFYAPDTIGFEKSVFAAMASFSGYEWLSQAKADPKWDNFFTVLYPSEFELLRIYGRRQIELILKDDAKRHQSYMVHHAFTFSLLKDREDFLKNLPWTGFEILSLPSVPDIKTNLFSLAIQRKAVLSLEWVDQFVVPLYKATKRYSGKYEGWAPILE